MLASFYVQGMVCPMLLYLQQGMMRPLIILQLVRAEDFRL